MSSAFRAPLKLISGCGLRLSECLALTIHDINGPDHKLRSMIAPKNNSWAGMRKTKKGRSILLNRCFISEDRPRLRQSMAVKKPLTMKNNGIRKPCTAEFMTSKAMTGRNFPMFVETWGFEPCSPQA